MPEKPKKVSKLDKNLERYALDVDKDLDNIFEYLRSEPRVFIQSTEPTIKNNSFAFWKDSDDSKYYLILNIAGNAKKVELA